jgi:hypothetical protein
MKLVRGQSRERWEWWGWNPPREKRKESDEVGILHEKRERRVMRLIRHRREKRKWWIDPPREVRVMRLLCREKRERWIEGWWEWWVELLFFSKSSIIQDESLFFRRQPGVFVSPFLVLDFGNCLIFERLNFYFYHQLIYSNWNLEFFNRSPIFEVGFNPRNWMPHTWMFCRRRWKGRLNQKN